MQAWHSLVLKAKQSRDSSAEVQVNPAELTHLTHTLDDRDSAIRTGMTVQDTRYEVCQQQ